MAKSRKLRLSGTARRDLEEIGAYTRREWGARQKRKYLGLIRDKLIALRDHPMAGAARDDLAEGLRACAVEKHIVYYRETETVLAVVRILHRRIDPARHL